ncbi:MAG: CBS domain-containing protein [bacterium]|nr:hypothetical protein [Deltaproteobacteria bacterium]MCP4906422.1 CBS domain-containing protein [bacterium]
MARGRLHRLPVVSQGRLLGIVTALDIVAAMADGLLVECPEENRPAPDLLLSGKCG